MHLVIRHEDLTRALSAVKRAVAKQSTMPVLRNILLRVDALDGVLAVGATNLEVAITTRVGCRTERVGATTLPAKLLCDVVSGLPVAPITLELDARTQITTITCGAYVTTIHGISADEFPENPTQDPPGQTTATFPATTWREMARRVGFAAATDNTRPVLTCVRLEYIDGGAAWRVAAADGYCAALSGTAPPGANSILIPILAFREIATLGAGTEDVQLIVSADGERIRAQTTDTTLIVRSLFGKYPDIDRIVPGSSVVRAILKRVDFIRALKLAEPFSAANSHIVRLAVTADSIVIASDASEIGSGNGSIDAIVTGEPTGIAVNINLLLNALNAIATPEVAVALQSSKSPIVLTPVGGDDIPQTVVVMPMSVQ